MSATPYKRFAAGGLVLMLWVGCVTCQSTVTATATAPSTPAGGSTAATGEVEGVSTATIPGATTLSEGTSPPEVATILAPTTVVPEEGSPPPVFPDVSGEGATIPATEVVTTLEGEVTTPSPSSAVSVEVYYTSYCPRVAYFITHQVAPTYRRLPGSVNLTLVPYGKANETQLENGTWSFECCPKSPINCFPDMLQTCAINILGTTDLYLPFITCLERCPPWQGGGQRCSRKFNVNYTQLEECTTSKEGNDWFHQMALETAKLNPPLDTIPRIVVNGASNRTIEMKAMKNLTRLVCELLQDPKPELCRRFSQIMPIERLVNSIRF